MIIVADLHLGRVSDSVYDMKGVPSRLTDSVVRLDEVLASAVDGGHSIVVAGDVFDRVNPTVQALKVFFDWLGRCQSSGVGVRIIAGNHDASVSLTNIHMMSSLNYQTYVLPELAKVDGVRVVMAPHLPRRDREELLGDQTYSEYLVSKFSGQADIVIGHGQVVGSDYTNDIFFEAGEAMEFDRGVLDEFVVYLGHIHNHSRYGNVHYPGSLLVHNYGEVDDEKGYFVVSGNGRKPQWVPWSSAVHEYRLVEVDLTEPKDLDEDVVREVAEGALLKVVYRVGRDTSVDTHRLTELFNRYGTVTRVATVVDDFEVSKVKKKLESSHNHSDLLKGWLKGRDLVSAELGRVLKLGVEIIEEVLGA